MSTPEAVPAPPARPPRFGLVSAAAVVNDAARWQDGFKFQPESCGESGRVAKDCGGSTDVVDPDFGPAVVEGEPFVVWAGDKCSTFGFSARDWEGRARRQLEATRSFQIAAELWTGSLGLAGRSLADPLSDQVTGGPTDELLALACLEAGLASCGEGRQGMIHVTPQILTTLAARFAVTLSGTTWVTPNGHIVVPDAGYDGSAPGGAPAGSSQWAYATSMVSLRLGEVVIIPNTLGEARDYAAAMARSTNEVVIVAEQIVAWQWDSCCHLAAEIDVPVCRIGGGS